MTCTGSAKRYHLCNTKVSSWCSSFFFLETHTFAHQKYYPNNLLDSTIELVITPTFTARNINKQITFLSFHFPLRNGKQTTVMVIQSHLTESGL